MEGNEPCIAPRLSAGPEEGVTPRLLEASEEVIHHEGGDTFPGYPESSNPARDDYHWRQQRAYMSALQDNED